MGKECILVVEDEADILEIVKFHLEREGFKVKTADTGEKCLAICMKAPPDLVLLDLMLPKIDGLEVCRRMRRDPVLMSVPIVMLTAKGEDSDIVAGLEIGADDYVVKPFNPSVLVARVKSVLRRGEISPDEELIRRGDLSINLKRRTVSIGVETIPSITFTEFEILRVLAQRPGWVFTRNQIVQKTKGSDYPVTERSVDVQIVGLRKKLGSAGRMIETVRGVGYRFKET